MVRCDGTRSSQSAPRPREAAFREPMAMITFEGTRSMESQIDGMHLKVEKMETNVTTKEQHIIFIQKVICRRVARPHDNPGMTSASMRKQTSDNEDKSMEAMLVLTNRGTPLHQGSIVSADWVWGRPKWIKG